MVKTISASDPGPDQRSAVTLQVERQWRIDILSWVEPYMTLLVEDVGVYYIES
jgi:hypothetical protein